MLKIQNVTRQLVPLVFDGEQINVLPRQTVIVPAKTDQIMQLARLGKLRIKGGLK